MHYCFAPYATRPQIGMGNGRTERERERVQILGLMYVMYVQYVHSLRDRSNLRGPNDKEEGKRKSIAKMGNSIGKVT